MPCPKVKSHIASGKIRTKTGTFTTKSEVNAKESIDNVENVQMLEDWELFGVTCEGLQNYALKALEWYQGANRDLKFFFNTAHEQLQQEAKQMRTLKEMWSIKICNRREVPLILYYDEHEEHEDTIIQSQQLIENRYNKLKHKLHGLQNAKKEIAKLQPYEVQRLASVYIRNIDYMSCCVRGWAKDFLVQGSLSSYQQGKHSKRLLLLSDEDISLAARTWLCSVSPKDRSPLSLKKKLEATIFPKLLGVPVTISEMTTRKFMHLWGFHKRAIGQQVYFDGHEREDVQEYCKSWAPRMINYRKKMDQYCGDEMKIVIPPELLEIWDSCSVIVTHDEVYFYANDDMSFFGLKIVNP
ncbi:24593_t:CDS:2 [Gigaspora margarita]|uniref:24593_t:CDS:1 n=1 Tax=Gigaspora margarita TaxID=4874 RepID=A0ABN7UY58_GIGMA|nr:24593_t:CDS:2 [Gigaspora margarita]